MIADISQWLRREPPRSTCDGVRGRTMAVHKRTVALRMDRGHSTRFPRTALQRSALRIATPLEFRTPPPRKDCALKSRRSARYSTDILVKTQKLKWEWRPEPESNRRARICSPLRNHSAIGPWNGASVEARPPLTGGSPHRQGATVRRPGIGLSTNDSWRGGFRPIERWQGDRLQHRSGRALNFRCIIGIQQQ